MQPLLIAGVLAGYRFLQKITGIELSPALKISILVFIFMAMFLAVEFNFYRRISIYDKILHSLSGIIFFFLGFTLFLHIAGPHETLRSNPLLAVLFSLFFAIAVAGCWEIFEFSVDHLFGMDCQKGSLTDTMGDIICGTSGATLTGVFQFISLRSRVQPKVSDDSDQFGLENAYVPVERQDSFIG